MIQTLNVFLFASYNFVHTCLIAYVPFDMFIYFIFIISLNPLDLSVK